MAVTPAGGLVVDGYHLVEGLPKVSAYLHLREASGLTTRREEQARLALLGSWWGCHVVHEPSGEVVAMGRLIGDGGWYFHVTDLATLPDHQRRGLGDLVMAALLDRIRAAAPAGAYVCLMADPPGRRLYAKHGFVEDAAVSVGMYRTLD